MAKSSFVKFLVNRDVFGQPITVLYKGSQTYKTKIGALCTVLVTVLVLVNTVMLAEGYISQSRQAENGQVISYDRFGAGKFYLN